MPSDAIRELAAIMQRNPDLRIDDATAGDVMADVSKAVSGSPRVQREEQMQRDLFTWIRGQEGYASELRWCFHVPNGGHRHPAVAGKMKAQGVRRGVPDLVLPVRRPRPVDQMWTGLALELKVGRNWLTEEQNDWLNILKTHGWMIDVIHDDWRIAANKIARYLGYDELVQEIE
jgi:hypothetical protein